MLGSKFVEFMLLNPMFECIGPLQILPEDVCRVVPATNETTNLVVDDNVGDVKSYLVQGSSTQVFNKLFGQTDVQKLQHHIDQLNKAVKARDERNSLLARELDIKEGQVMDLQRNMKAAVDHIQARLDASTQRNTEYIRENQRLKDQNENYVKMFEQTAKTEGELRDALKYWQDSYTKSQERVAELYATKASPEELTEELARFKSMHSGQRIIIERLQGEAHQTEARIKELEKALQSVTLNPCIVISLN